MPPRSPRGRTARAEAVEHGGRRVSSAFMLLIGAFRRTVQIPPDAEIDGGAVRRLAPPAQISAPTRAVRASLARRARRSTCDLGGGSGHAADQSRGGYDARGTASTPACPRCCCSNPAVRSVGPWRLARAIRRPARRDGSAPGDHHQPTRARAAGRGVAQRLGLAEPAPRAGRRGVHPPAKPDRGCPRHAQHRARPRSLRARARTTRQPRCHCAGSEGRGRVLELRAGARR
jgi:hypothetical protein